jgi:hypothetical protein
MTHFLFLLSAQRLVLRYESIPFIYEKIGWLVKSGQVHTREPCFPLPRRLSISVHVTPHLCTLCP